MLSYRGIRQDLQSQIVYNKKIRNLYINQTSNTCRIVYPPLPMLLMPQPSKIKLLLTFADRLWNARGCASHLLEGTLLDPDVNIKREFEVVICLIHLGVMLSPCAWPSNPDTNVLPHIPAVSLEHTSLLNIIISLPFWQ